MEQKAGRIMDYLYHFGAAKSYDHSNKFVPYVGDWMSSHFQKDDKTQSSKPKSKLSSSGEKVILNRGSGE